MKELLIYGCGSLGRMVEQIVFDINREEPRWRLLGYLDDAREKQGKSVSGLPVLGGGELLEKFPEASLVLGLADPRAKRALVFRLEDAGAKNFASLVHPRVWISRRVLIAPGCVVYPGVHIDVDVEIGDHVTLNKLCTIGHDCRLGSFVTVAPGVNLGGSNRIGEGAEFGINSSTVQGLAIGEWSIIGAGAAVIRDVPPGRIFAGVPAKEIKAAPPRI